MAMNPQDLAQIIKINMTKLQPDYLSGEKSADDAYLAFSEAIVTYITLNAEVVVTGGSSAGVYKVT